MTIIRRAARSSLITGRRSPEHDVWVVILPSESSGPRPRPISSLSSPPVVSWSPPLTSSLLPALLLTLVLYS
jgi:hypothetical protein